MTRLLATEIRAIPSKIHGTKNGTHKIAPNRHRQIKAPAITHANAPAAGNKTEFCATSETAATTKTNSTHVRRALNNSHPGRPVDAHSAITVTLAETIS